MLSHVLIEFQHVTLSRALHHVILLLRKKKTLINFYYYYLENVLVIKIKEIHFTSDLYLGFK